MRVLALFGSAFLFGACAGTSPLVADVAALEQWSGSATIAEEGPVMSATYSEWPVPFAPAVFACATPPDRVFGPAPESGLLLVTDPACIPFRVELRRDDLVTSLDRSKLPGVFAGLESWTVVIGVASGEVQWSLTKVMRADLPEPFG